MDIVMLISLISAIAALLLIVFKVPQKISITLTGFLIILSICVLAILFIESVILKHNTSSEDNKDTDDVREESEYTNDNDYDDSSLVEAGGSEFETADQKSDDTIDAISNEITLNVDSIHDSVYNADLIEESVIQVPSVNILECYGNIAMEGQEDNYEYTPEDSGIYRFEFSGVPNGTDLQLKIYNSGRELIKSDYDLDNEDGVTIMLDRAETYIISVEQYRNFGEYTLNIGQKKPLIDIASNTSVYDSVQYKDQENDYSLMAKNEGVYRFEFSGVPNGTDFAMEVYNSGWELIESDYDLDNGGGITVALAKDEYYYVRVKQYRGIGDYVLNIGHKKAIIDVTEYTEINDSIQYTNQQNDYLFQAKNEGVYRFEFSGVPNGTDFTMEVYNSGWELMQTDYDLDTGDGLTVLLEKGELYYIRVQQYRDVGAYKLKIGTKKDVVDITEHTVVADSVQYTGQENDYSLEIDKDGTYNIAFSEVKEGVDLSLSLYNSGWELIDSYHDLDNSDGVDVSFNEGEIYYIRIVQCNGYGQYALMINESCTDFDE